MPANLLLVLVVADLCEDAILLVLAHGLTGGGTTVAEFAWLPSILVGATYVKLAAAAMLLAEIERMEPSVEQARQDQERLRSELARLEAEFDRQKRATAEAEAELRDVRKHGTRVEATPAPTPSPVASN